MSYFTLPLFTKKKTEDIDMFYSSNVAYHATTLKAMKFFAKSICTPF